MARNTPAPAEPERPLQGGAGGGTYDRVEARIAKLEAHMEHVQSDLAKLGGLPADIAGIKADIAGMKSDLAKLGGLPADNAGIKADIAGMKSDLAELGGLPADNAGLKVDIAGMKSDISHLPTKDYLSQQFDVQFRWIVGVVSMVAALIGLIVRVTM